METAIWKLEEPLYQLSHPPSLITLVMFDDAELFFLHNISDISMWNKFTKLSYKNSLFMFKVLWSIVKRKCCISSLSGNRCSMSSSNMQNAKGLLAVTSLCQFFSVVEKSKYIVYHPWFDHAHWYGNMDTNLVWGTTTCVVFLSMQEIAQTVISIINKDWK